MKRSKRELSALKSAYEICSLVIDHSGNVISGSTPDEFIKSDVRWFNMAEEFISWYEYGTKQPSPEKKNLTIEEVDAKRAAFNRHIELHRDDLLESKKCLPASEIKITHFKYSSVTMSEIFFAKKVVFVDGEEVNVLKSRYAYER